jgi:hypothetical protein
MLATQLDCRIPKFVEVVQINLGCLEQFVNLFDAIASTSQVLNDYEFLLRVCQGYTPAAHRAAVLDRITKVETTEASLRSQYSRTLARVRAGSSEESSLRKILRDFTTGCAAVQQLTDVVSDTYIEKLKVV